VVATSTEAISLINDINLIFHNFNQFIKSRKEKIFFYKHFLRISHTIILDFNEDHELIFQSRVILPSLRQSFQIFTESGNKGKTSYKDVLKSNKKLLNELEKNLIWTKENYSAGNNFFPSEYNPDIEFYIFMDDNSTTGFTLIFHTY